MKTTEEQRTKAVLDMAGRIAEAEEIIKLLLWDLRNRSYNPDKDITRAEKFLKEAHHD